MTTDFAPLLDPDITSPLFKVPVWFLRERILFSGSHPSTSTTALYPEEVNIVSPGV